MKVRSSRTLAFITFPAAVLLVPVVLYDYRERRMGRRPDRWHWADRALWRLGWVAL